MRGERVVTQRDVVSAKDIGVEAVGLGGYVFDTHTARRYACTPGSPPDRNVQCIVPRRSTTDRGCAYDESHMVSDPGLFQLPRSLLLPRRAEATNLAVPTAVSATHVVFSSIRMEPQWMVLGHAAGVLVALALGDNRTAVDAAVAVQDVPGARLNAVLRDQGAMLDRPSPPQIPMQTSSCVLNRCIPVHAPGANAREMKRPCQFCKGLASNEWLAPVADFAPTDRTSTNITALRPTTLRKSLVPDAATDLPVPGGYSCGRTYLQHFRGVWICTISEVTPNKLSGQKWYAWKPMWVLGAHNASIRATEKRAVLKREYAPSSSLPPSEIRIFHANATVELQAGPEAVIQAGDPQYWVVTVAGNSTG